MINEETDKAIASENNQDTKNKKSSFRKKWHTVNERFLDLAKEVQCECFPKIFEESNLVQKLIWTAFFLVFSGLTIYLLAQNVVNYFRQGFLL